jgi:hypothetical protein
VPADKDSELPRRAEAARQMVSKVLRRPAGAGEPSTPTPAPAPVARQQPQRRPEDGGPGIGEARETFFRTLERSGDFGSAAAATTRAHLKRGGSNRARFFAQLLQQQGGAVRHVGDICLAITAMADDLPHNAWRLFQGADLSEVLRLAPAEYLRIAFETDGEQARDVLAGLLRGDFSSEADAASWFDIAATSSVAGRADLS